MQWDEFGEAAILFIVYVQFVGIIACAKRKLEEDCG